MNPEEKAVVRLSRLLSANDLAKIKIACYGLQDFNLGSSQNESDRFSLYDIYDSLTAYMQMPQEPVTFIHQVRVHLNCKDVDTGLQSFILKDHESYDIREKYPSVDLRLTVMSFVNALTKNEFKVLRRFLHSEKEIPGRRMRSRLSLVEALFSESVVRENELSDIFAIASCFRKEDMFCEYAARRSIQISDHQAQVDVTALKRQVEDLPKENRKKYVFEVLVILVIFVIVGLAITAAIMMLVLYLTPKHTDYINISDKSIVEINYPERFSGSLDSVKLVLSSTDDSAEVSVYQQSCHLVTGSQTQLPVHSIPELYTKYFRRHPFNYNGTDNPLYGTTGSYLQFQVYMYSSSVRHINHGCQRISVFTDYDFYADAIDPQTNGENNSTKMNGIVKQSHCLSVGSHGISAASSWNYTYESSGYVYVTIDGGPYVVINGNISGSVKTYNADGLKPICSDKSTLTTDSSECSVEICGSICTKTKPKQCIFVQSMANVLSRTKVTYTNYEPILSPNVLCVLYADGALMMLFIFIVTCYSIYYCYKKCSKTRNQHLNALQRRADGYHFLSSIQDTKSVQSEFKDGDFFDETV